MSDGNILVELERVSKRYGSPEGAGARAVLDDVSLVLEAGRSIAVTGHSGSGKTTLLNIMGALDRPTSGRVLFEGEDLAEMGEAELAAIRNRRIGFVFQLHHLLPQCTVLENVLVPTLAEVRLPGGRGERAKAAEERARRLLDRVGLSSRLSHRPGQLSGGERQRVAVVRALVNNPALLLADEPTGELDRASGAALSDLLLEFGREQGVALVVVTHSPDLAARAEQVYELRDGRLTPAKGRT